MVLQHDRTLDHYGTEDSLTTTLAADIGRYAAGSTVQSVLEDFVARLAFVESAGCDIRIFAITANAAINKPGAPTFTVDAIIRDPAKELTTNAVIFKTVAPTLTANAVLVENVICP